MLLKGGRVVTADAVELFDLRMGERIEAIAPSLEQKAGEEVLDVTGCFLLPGVMDAHTHFGFKTAFGVTEEAHESSQSAALGGVTTVIDYADFLPGAPFSCALEKRKKEFSGSLVDYNFHLLLHGGFLASDLKELRVLRDLGLKSIKIFTTYKELGLLLNPSLLSAVVKTCAENQILVTVHAESEAVMEKTRALYGQHLGDLGYLSRIRPIEAEVAAIEELATLSARFDCPIYVVHLSSDEGYFRIKEARSKGIPLHAETAPQYLLLDETYLSKEEPERYLCIPPLRRKSSQEGLWQGIAENGIEVVATDHCGYSLAAKIAAKGELFGLPGISTLLPLLYTYGVAEGRISLPQMVRVLSTNPARLFGLYPRKGHLAVGADADLVIYDPKGEGQIKDEAIAAKVGHSPYHNFVVKGQVRGTFLRGRPLVLEGVLREKEGFGQFVFAGEDSDGERK